MKRKLFAACLSHSNSFLLCFLFWFETFSRNGDRYAPETVSKAVSRGNNYDASADNDVSLMIDCAVFKHFICKHIVFVLPWQLKKIRIVFRIQDPREKKKQSCTWCGNHIKSTICLGVLFILLFAGILLTHLFIYWSKYLARVRPDDKVMSIGAIPFPAVTICPGTRAGYPPLNFTHLLRVMQVYREPQLKLDEYVIWFDLNWFFDSIFLVLFDDLLFLMPISTIFSRPQEICNGNTTANLSRGYPEFSAKSWIFGEIQPWRISIWYFWIDFVAHHWIHQELSMAQWKNPMQCQFPANHHGRREMFLICKNPNLCANISRRFFSWLQFFKIDFSFFVDFQNLLSSNEIFTNRWVDWSMHFCLFTIFTQGRIPRFHFMGFGEKQGKFCMKSGDNFR